MILIVDDHADTGEALTKLCQKRGMDAKYVTSGDEALASVYTDGPEVIVLDHMMPGRTGMEVLEALNREGRLEKTRVIFLSAVFDWDVFQKAKQLGAKQWLVKGTVRMTDVVDEVAEQAGRVN